MTWPGVGRTAWLPGNAILFSARERAQGPYQFWTVQFPDGTATRITNDARGFGDFSVSVTADGSTIATVPWDIVANLWSTTPDGSGALEQWTSGLRPDGEDGLAASASGVFYSSVDGTGLGIWRVDAPGGRPRRLTQQEAASPSAPADGRFVVFEAVHEGRYRIWRMEADGSDARVITRGEDDIRPRVSPDGRWVYYETPEGLMRVPADGSEAATRFGPPRSVMADVSPDGRRILAGAPAEPPAKGGLGPVLLDADTGAVLTRLSNTIAMDADTAPGFGRTSDVVVYARHLNGVGNVWEQPLGGGPARQLTKFTSGRIANVAYSTDRQRLFLAKGTRTGDVVLIRNFR
jgi:Tol biopolymer transport system component